MFCIACILRVHKWMMHIFRQKCTLCPVKCIALLDCIECMQFGRAATLHFMGGGGVVIAKLQSIISQEYHISHN